MVKRNESNSNSLVETEGTEKQREVELEMDESVLVSGPDGDVTGTASSPDPSASGSKSSTEAVIESIKEAKSSGNVVPGSGFVAPTRDASGQVIRVVAPDDDRAPVILPEPGTADAPDGDPLVGHFRVMPADASVSPQDRISEALKEAGMDNTPEPPPLDARAYRAQEAARVRLAAEAAKLDQAPGGGRFMVGGVMVDSEGRRVDG